jgi:hypothetical protein
MEVKVQDQPKLKVAEEVLERLDRNWQILVQLYKEGQGKPATPFLDSANPASDKAAGDHLEANASPLNIEADTNCFNRSTPDSLPPGKTGAGTPLPNDAMETNLSEPQPEQLSQKSLWQKVFNVSILVLLVASLGTLAFLVAQTQMGRGGVDTGRLTIRGQDGAPLAWLGERDGQVSLCLLDKAGRSRLEVSLDASGNPSLSLLDELQQKRGEIKLGPGGEPLLSQSKEPAPPTINESQAAPLSGSTVAAAVDPTPETADLKKPSAVPTSPELPAVEPEAKIPIPDPPVKYVGSKTSNKYHYPDCKWAKTIWPARMVGFKSVEHAHEDGYIPCPVCKPPVTDNPVLPSSLEYWR